MSALFAYIHSVSMIALGTLLVMQLLGLGEIDDRQRLQRFFVLCVGIAVAAAVMLLSGIALLLWPAQTPEFYLRNPVFYIKLALFSAMILVAITPARLIVQWHRRAAQGEGPDAAEIVFVWRYFAAEAVLFLLIPLAAVISGQGIGLQVSPS